MIARKDNIIVACCGWSQMYITRRGDQAYFEITKEDGIYLIDPAPEPIGVLHVPINYCPYCGAKTEIE